MKRKAFIPIAIAVAMLSACQDSEESATTDSEKPAEPTTVTDGVGNEVTIPENPSRIVGSYLEDPLVTLGVTPALQWSVANRSSTQVYLESFLDGVDTIDSQLPLEALMDAEPDLIFAAGAESLASGDYEQYNQIAPTYIINSETTDDWRATLTEMAEVLHKEDTATEALADYDEHVEDVKNDLTEAIGDSKVAALWVIGGKYFVVAPDVASGAVLFEDLELTPANVIADLPDDVDAHWNPISLEALAELDADYLFLIDSDPESIESLKSESIWSNIPAVEQGHIYDISGSSSWLYNGYQANTQTIDSVYENILDQ